MRGDQLVRQWWVNRGIEGNPNGLTMAEIARCDGAQGTAAKRSPSKACSKNWDRLFCYWKGAKANRLLDAFLKAGPDSRGEEGERFPLPPLLILGGIR
jgi:hypothetical protein